MRKSRNVAPQRIRIPVFANTIFLKQFAISSPQLFKETLLLNCKPAYQQWHFSTIQIFIEEVLLLQSMAEARIKKVAELRFHCAQR
jgi:hypothetical protein